MAMVEPEPIASELVKKMKEKSREITTAARDGSLVILKKWV